MKVFKFGGASVNSANAVRNMASILQKYSDDRTVVVISAMGKTTNKLELLVPGVSDAQQQPILLKELIEYHTKLLKSSFPTRKIQSMRRSPTFSRHYGTA